SCCVVSSTCILLDALRVFYLFSLMSSPPPSSTLFPYTTLSDLLQGMFRRGGVVTGRSQRKLSDTRIVLCIVEILIAGRERVVRRSEEHTSELQSRGQLVCCLLLEKKKYCLSLVSLSLKIQRIEA